MNLMQKIEHTWQSKMKDLNNTQYNKGTNTDLSQKKTQQTKQNKKLEHIWQSKMNDLNNSLPSTIQVAILIQNHC